ncbi:hypothetical protein VPHD292_0061 [Vibrio phage D292]
MIRAHTHYHPVTGMYYWFEKETKRYYYCTVKSRFFPSRKRYSGMKTGFLRL